VPTTVTLMPPAVENALSSLLEAVAAVCTVPWIVAPLVPAEGEVGEVADELHPTALLIRAKTDSDMSTRMRAFIEKPPSIGVLAARVALQEGSVALRPRVPPGLL
jgi:hypothetical protein